MTESTANDRGVQGLDRRAASPDIAILGYGCRLPGADDPDGFWRLMLEGRCAVGSVGPERWSARAFLSGDRAAAGRTYTAAAGLLDDPMGFDAAFFGISPREAAQMDPQQRLILQVAWEAVEHAGLTPARLAGPRTGVYVGASGLDYGNRQAGDPASADAQFMTGNTLSIIPNRLSYVLDAQGPSYLIDTACSSSLFAFHAACAALKAGEIDVAVVGGVNLLLTPMPFIGFSRAGMLSPTGLCKPFDASADGYVRAEGAVAFALGRLDAARAAGDPVRGVVVGSAINSDGRAGPLSVPNGARQADLMRAVYGAAGVAADDLAFVEAHGTGTAVGDPIEAGAIGAALGAGRSAPLPIGSAKSNVGHLEPASGLVGLLKAQMALERGLLPPTLHLRTPNPAIPFEALNVAPAREAAPLGERATPWVAGVNSFGFGGANAHVAIRQASAAEAAPAQAVAPRRDAPLIVSAASEEALKALAARWRERLDGVDEDEAAELAAAAAHRRARLPRRLVVLDSGVEARRRALGAYADGTGGGRWAADAAAAGASAPVAFVFSGNGSQYAGMGRSAYAEDAAFRASFDATAACVRAEGGVDLLEELSRPDLGERLAQASVAQPLLFAVQAAIVDALAARGARPAAVAGHSVGEVGAAWASGALSRAQAARLAVRRARRQGPLFGTGAMAAVLASADDARRLIEQAGIEGVDVAADNSPRGATVTGPGAAIDALAAAAKGARVAVRKLKVDYPFHGPLMERIRAELLEDLADLAPSASAIPFVSSAEGALTPGEALDGRYWWRNARQAVLFRQAVGGLAELGCRVFVEIGPQPTLMNYVSDTLAATGAAFAALPSLKRQGAGAEDIGLVAARIVAAGGAVDEAAYFGPATPLRAAPPAYPWRKVAHAIQPTPERLNVIRTPAPRALLGWRATPEDGPWRLTLDVATHPWLGDHAVDGAAAVPAAAMVELALAAAAETLGEGPLELTDFDLTRPLSLDGGARIELRTACDAEGVTRIESRPHLRDEAWAVNAAGVARRAPGAAPKPGAAQGHAAAPDGGLYAALEGIGLAYGPAFRRAGPVRVHAAAGTAEAALTPPAVETAAPWVLDPTALDAAFHLLAAALGAGGGPADGGVVHLPVRVGRLTVHAPGATPASAEARILRVGARSVEARFTLRAADGSVAAEAEGVRFAALRIGRGAEAGRKLWRMGTRALHGGAGAHEAEMEPPMRRLEALGLAQAEAPEPDAGALILDAACRRLAWDVARGLAPDGGVGLRARRALDADMRRALERGLAALVEDGAYDPAADQAGEAPPGPPLATLVAALIEEAPDRAADLAEFLRLAARFERGAAGDPGRAARANPEVWDALARGGLDALSARPPGAPCDVALVGQAPERLAQALRDAGASRVEIVEVDDDGAALRAAAARRGAFDLVLGGFGFARAGTAALRAAAAAMRPRGTLLAAAPGPELMREMIEAADAVDPGHGPTDPAAWATLAASAGLARPEAGWLSTPRIAAYALAARAGGAAAARPLPMEAVTLWAGSRDADLARATAERIGAAARVAPVGEAPAAGGAAVLFLEGGDGPAAERVMTGFARLRAALDAAPSRLLAVTRGGGADPVSAALGRAVRVIANERPDFDLRALDLAPGLGAEAAAMAVLETLAGTERETAASPGGLRAPRIEPAEEMVGRAAATRAGGPCALRLETGEAGGIEGLRWTPVARRAPGPGEIEIAVRAAGLNFRDVMWAMGVLPEEAIEDGFAGAAMGMECAGVVTRAGPGAAFAPGDRVMGFAAAALATHAVIGEGAAARIPEGMGFEAAASLPVVFATAWRGLVDLGRLEAGETVLIHGGAGGVGLAALQIARARGARAFATAGSAAKRRLLTLLGAERAFDSRGLDFAEAVMAATGGQGVDVALNSLSGEAMERTLGCLKPFGRFVELGKRDFYANTRVGLRPLRRNVSYFGVDLDAMLAARPDSARPLLAALAEQAGAGGLRPPPFRVARHDAARDAFRLMQRSGHLGKIVIAPPPAPVVAKASAPLARADRAWLVTGGTRGFGLAFAERLAERGAGALWLASRSGELDADARARLEALGARVEVRACDAADQEAVAALMADIDASGTPLGGVAHAATAPSDALFDNLDAASARAALRAKLDGALALDAAERGRDGPALAHFVLFSSIAAWIGNPGQTAYVAANAGLEALAAARLAEGRPALALAFGPIADAGMLAEDAAARARLERQGVAPMTARAAFDALETALAAQGPGDAAVAAASVRWGALAADLPALRAGLAERLDLSAGARAAAAGASDLRARLKVLDEAAAVRAMIDLFLAEASIILRLDPQEIDPTKPMSDLGFDSLMAVELKLSCEEKYGVSMPVLSLSEGATIAILAARVAAQMRDPAAPSAEETSDLGVVTARHLGADAAARVAERLGAAGAVAVAEDAP
jgi:acyl transferase domain-containing protein/NADPH:quinone reductase-like Zn-dependent oxidoreductase/short-subunit dehydrogenase/acyl carrier protein